MRLSVALSPAIFFRVVLPFIKTETFFESAPESIQLGRLGYIESREEYLALLEEGDVVLSTALHDFQGLSIMEAVQRGCMPLVPDALAYKEQYPKFYRYTWNENPQACAANAIDRLQLMVDEKNPPSLNVEAFSWSSLKTQYKQLLDDVAAG